MPTYVSHAIMASDVYDRIDNKNISLNYMLTYSLGGDLARFSKCQRTCHNVKMEEFIDNMWLYMKENNLDKDKNYLGVLYGHICHYYMDRICHPLIRKVDKISINVGIKSHTLIEGYIDSYLVKDKYYLDLEIAFYEKLIKRFEDALNISHNEIKYGDMTKKEMMEFFNKNLKSIDMAISKMCERYSKDMKYIEDGIIFVKAEGVKYINEKYYRESYLNYLEKLKRNLEVKYEEKY